MRHPDRPYRRAQEGGAVEAGNHAEEQRHSKADDGFQILRHRHDHKRQHHDAGGDGGVQRPAEGLPQADVDNFIDARFGAKTRAVLTDTVIDNDRVVKRVTEDGQHHRHEVIVERDAEDHKREVDDQQVVRQSRDRHQRGGHAADLAEADRHIYDQEDRRKQGRKQTLDEEERTDSRADGVRTHLLDRIVGEFFGHRRFDRLFLFVGDVARVIHIEHLDTAAVGQLRGAAATELLGEEALGLRRINGAGVAVLEHRTAGERHVQLDAENQVEDQADHDDAGADDQKRFAIFDKIKGHLFIHLRSPPYNHGLRKILSRETERSIKRESATPITKFSTTPTNSV